MGQIMICTKQDRSRHAESKMYHYDYIKAGRPNATLTL